MQKNKSRSIKNALIFLEKNQKKDGNFLSFSSTDKKISKDIKKLNSVFSSALILSSLHSLKNTEKIKNKLANFLMAQKNDFWSFNYWTRNSKESKKFPYPDDLDDTFCALCALSLFDEKIIDGEALAKIVTLLTATEEKEGGPYRTWLIPPNSDTVWKDVDIAVNSNIAFFLSLKGVSLKNINNLIEKSIDKKKYFSPYYPSEYPIIYFISRFYSKKKKEKIIKFLLSKQKKNGAWQNPLNTALSLSSLINLKYKGPAIKKGFEYLLKSQKENGSWSPYAFCLDPSINGKKYYSGSPYLTTAFCLEAFNKIEKPVKKNMKKQKLYELKIYNTVKDNAIERFLELGPELRDAAKNQFKKIIASRRNKEIILLPFYFLSSFKKEKEYTLKEIEHLTELGLANLYGWMAYTIYDDFLDEDGDSATLSVANLCLRNLTEIFTNTEYKNNNFDKFFQQIMDKIDSANSWEIKNCRMKIKDDAIYIPDTLPKYKNYSKLAERSLGHTLGPLAILFFLGYKKNSSETKQVFSFFKHYTIARQLNDDAHDWEEDLKKGHINSSGALILKNLKKRNITKIKKDDFTNKLQIIFWNEVIDIVCEKILFEVNEAEKILKKLKIIRDKKIFSKLLDSPKRAAKKAISEKKESLKFLNSYK